MSFRDFISNFKLLNVCKVGDYPEIRVKGEFIKDADQTVYSNQVRSRFQYEIEIEQKKTINFSIHQDDVRIQYTILRKPYVAIGMVILRKDPSGKLELIYMKEFQSERQIELEIELDVGEYVVLPRTSGCGIQRPPNAQKQAKIQLLDKNGELSSIAALIAKDLFRRLDKISIDNAL